MIKLQGFLPQLCCFLLTGSLVLVLPSDGQAAEAGSSAAPVHTGGQLPLEDLRTFARVMEQIRVAYVEEVDDKTLLENAIRGMLGELDPHSAYLDEKDFADLQDTTTGEFGGLGIEVGMEDGFVKVITPIDDTPASKAGIEAGDLIIKLGEKSVQGMSLGEAVSIMRGKKGEPLDITILRKGNEKPIEVTVVRDIIKVQSVRSKMLEPGYGYVRIAQFQVNTGEELQKSLETLKGKNEFKGLVLDLRNNPGGILQAAVEVSDAFLDQGLIVYTKGRMEQGNLRFSAEKGDFLDGAPVVVLVNDGSASAAEIVAGALQDHRRAIVLGTDSFGKGSVQTVMPISETKAIKLTTALYYTPSGRSIQAQGIKPDIVVERAKVTALPKSLRTAEVDLDKHLDNGSNDHKTDDGKDGKKNASVTNTKPDDNARTEEEDDERWQDDNQLHDALNVLKAMYLSKARS